MRPLEGSERRAALDLVEEIQETEREGNRIASADIPHVLLSYQTAWHADMSPVRIAKKSRRIGFSWGALAAEAALEAATTKAGGGMNNYYMGYNLHMTATFIGDVAFFARAYQITASAIDVLADTVVIANEKRDITIYKVRLASGHVVEALSGVPDNWRSRGGHARIDEAAFVSNLGEILKGAMAFRLWGGRIDIVSTLNGEDNEFTRLCKDVDAGRLTYSAHRVTFADALRDGFYRRVCLIRGWRWSPEAEAEYERSIRADYLSAEDAAEELDCQPKKGSGVYFPRFLIEACQQQLPVIRHARGSDFVLAPDRAVKTEAWIHEHLHPVIAGLPPRRSVLGQDFGRSGDLSVIWVLQFDAGRWVTGFILELRNIPFDVQQQILFHTLDHIPLFHHAKFDARGNGQSHAEAALQRYGPTRVECVQLSAPWYAEHFPRYRHAYEERRIAVPASEDLIQDHRSVILHAGRPAISDARTMGSDGGQRHGDSAVAGVLAWAAAETEAEPPAGATVNPAGSATRAAGLFGQGWGRRISGLLVPRKKGLS